MFSLSSPPLTLTFSPSGSDSGVHVLCLAKELCAAKLKWEERALQESKKRTKKWREQTKKMISSLSTDQGQSSNELEPPKDLSTLEDKGWLTDDIIKFYFK